MTTEQEKADIREALEYLRGRIRAESISYGEVAHLQSLAGHIEPGDVELLEWAGVPEFANQEEAKERATCSRCLARTYRGEECVCEDGGDAEDYFEALAATEEAE